MTEHLTDKTIQNYRTRELGPAELLKADDHLAECDLCFKQIRDFTQKADIGDLEQLSPEVSEHISYEQLESYVDQKADALQREIADVHLQVCSACAADLNGLIQMRAFVDHDLQKPAEKRSFFAPIGDFFAASYLPRLGFATLALLLLSVGVFWMVNRKPASEVALITPPESITPPQTPVPAISPDVVNFQTPTPTPTPDENKTFPPEYKAEIEQVLVQNRLNFPVELAQLNSRTGKLMSGGSDSVPFALTGPIGKIIATNRPQFRWRALDGAEGYVVSVYDENFNKVATSPQVSGTSWQVDRSLSGGKTYIWQVAAIKDGNEIKSPVRPAPDARFKIIDPNKANEIARLSKQYKDEHLFLGIMYAKAGLLDEAAREFRKEISKNRGSKKARKFLQDVRAKR